jgi:hypothetical protein
VTVKVIHAATIPSYSVAFTTSGPPRAPALTISESMERYGTIAFALEMADAAVVSARERGFCPHGEVNFGAWLDVVVPPEIRFRVRSLAEELAPRVLRQFSGLPLDRYNERAVTDWLIGAIVYRIEELGGRAWLEGRVRT